MPNVLSPNPKQQFFGNNGEPAVGYKLYTYSAGTSTKIASYPDENTGVPNANPIMLDFRGECNLWIPPNVSYKLVFANPSDTDPPTNPIWSVDNLVSSQLLTLYGGVDVGVTNSYVLNFVANFSAYTDGIVIYWIPSHTNIGASTINVNGLGPVPIVNQDGTPLTPGQLASGQVSTIIYSGGEFLLLASATTTNLWGGESTGTSGDYILDASQVAAYYDGLIIYWIPNVTFAGGTCTINVNGLGDRGILNSDQSPIQPGQLVEGQVAQIIYNGPEEFFFLLGPISGQFTVTLTGVTATVTGTARWTRNGRQVSLLLPALSGTSNSTSKTYTGMPNTLRPAFNVTSVTTGINNSGAAQEVITASVAAASNVISFFRLTSDGLWTGSGVCSVSGGTLVYEATG